MYQPLEPPQPPLCLHVVLGSVLITLVGASMHFIYHLSGCNAGVAVFCAVNESTWEHIKIMLFPMLLWWFFLGCLGFPVDGLCWAVYVALAVLLVGNGVSLAGNFESLAYDIVLFSVSIVCGQYAGALLSGHWWFVVPVVVFLCFFTYYPPGWEYMFYDRAHGRYGVPFNCSE